MCLFDLKMGRMEISNAIQLSYSHLSVTPYMCDPRASCSPSIIFHMRYRVYPEGKPCLVVCSLISLIGVRRFWWCRLRYDASWWRWSANSRVRDTYNVQRELVIFTNVGSYVATLISTSLVTESECVVRCAERTVVSAVEFVSERVTRRVAHTVVSAVEFVSDSLDSILLAHVSHRSELSGVAFLHVMQLTGDACLST